MHKARLRICISARVEMSPAKTPLFLAEFILSSNVQRVKVSTAKVRVKAVSLRVVFYADVEH